MQRHISYLASGIGSELAFVGVFLAEWVPFRLSLVLGSAMALLFVLFAASQSS
ncbi:MAG: hypothetical protein ABEH35_04970 [Haloarculaceae archaeon]